MLGYCALFLTVSISDVLLRELRPADYRALTDPEAASPRWYLITLALAIVLGIATGIGVNRIVRRRQLTVREVTLLTTAAPLAMLALPWVDSALGLSSGPVPELIGNAIAIGIALLLTKVGAGAIVAWSIRRALGQGLALTSLTARALPMILLVTLFSFFSEAMWTVTGTLPRGELWKVILILLAIAAVFVWAVIRDELRSIAEGPHVDLEDMRRRGFPVSALAASPDAVEEHVTLSRRESANAMALLLIAEGIQLGFLVVLVFAFFCMFGAIAVPDTVVASWTGHAPTTGTLMGLRLRISNELIQTSLFLAAFSAVSFAASSVTDPAYRKSFFDPLLEEVAVTVTARHLYRASRDATVTEPAPAEPGTLASA